MSTVGDLTLNDIGRWVQIKGRDSWIEGRLNAFEVVTDWIDDVRMDGAITDRVPGSRTVTVTVGVWSTSNLPLDTEARVLS